MHTTTWMTLQRKKANSKELHTVWYNLQGMLEMTNKITEMQNRLVVSKSQEEGEGKVGMNRIRYTVVREMFCILTISML